MNGFDAYGNKHTVKTKQQISKYAKENYSEEKRLKTSKFHKGRNKPTTICTYCGKEGGI